MNTPFCSALVLLLAGLFVGRTEAAAGWSTNLGTSLKLARELKKPALLDFSATWCGPCKLMSRTTLQDEAVLRQLDHFACVLIDLDANRALAQQHSIEAVPTFLILSGQGAEVSRATGYMEAGRFTSWLTNGLAAHEGFVAQEEKFRALQDVLPAILQGTDAAARGQAVKELFDLCGERASERQRFAAEQLKMLAARDPTVLLDGLNHPRLATRIEVANLLRQTLGEDFTFDPWETVAERERMVAIWKGRLQKGKPKPVLH